VVSQLFRTAIAAGKQARTDTEIARNAVSVGHAAVELARGIFGNLRGRAVLVIGLGQIGKVAAANLAAAGARLTIINRTTERATARAARLAAAARPWADLPAALAASDIVVSGTSAAEPVVSAALVRAAVQARRGQPLLLIDLAVPRDIDPAAGRLPTVYLYDIDGLQAICQANMAERAGEIAAVEAIVAEQVERFAAWLEERQVVPTIAALRGQAERIRRAELDKALARLGHLSERERNTIAALSHAIVNKLLHEPSIRLKQARSHGHVQAVRELFALADDVDPSPAAPGGGQPWTEGGSIGAPPAE
jgi:glutamyl-tRNA reductase